MFGKLGVALIPQVVFHLSQQGLQRAASNAQGYTGGKNVDDHQVQQTGDHRTVAIKALGVVGA